MNKTAEERERTPAYIATCSRCHGMIGAHVDDGEHRREMAAFVGQYIQAGYTLERRTVGEARVMEWCNCEKVTR